VRLWTEFIKTVCRNLGWFDLWADYKRHRLLKTMRRLAKIIPAQCPNEFIYGGGTLHAKLPNGVELIYNPEIRDRGMHKIFLGDSFEKAEREELEKIMAPCGVFFDVGACFGLFSLELTKKYPHCRAYAFEPTADAFRMLRHNIRRNHLEARIFPFRLAVGSDSKPRRVTSGNLGYDHVLPEDSPGNGLCGEGVEGMTVDRFVKEQKIDSLSLMKCDVEGYEYHVLQGAVETIDRFRPIVFLEIAPTLLLKFGHRPSDIHGFLTSRNYSRRCLTPHYGNPDIGNILFIPREGGIRK
jgi:FkbM family methyltransferase